MKFTLTRTRALAVFMQALKTCNVKSKGQPDSEFLFKMQGDKLYVTSLNHLAEQTLLVPAENLSGEEDEAFSVSGQAVVEFVKTISDEEISCVYNSAKSVFMMGSTVRQTKFAFPVGDAGDFIPVNFRAQGAEFEVEAAQFAEALRCTAFAASTDSSKAPQNAVRLRINGEMLVAEATDFFRISCYSADVSDTGVSQQTLLIPRDIADVLAGGLLSDVEIVTVQPAANHVRFKWNDTVFTTSLVDEIQKKFENVDRFFAGEVHGSAKVSKGDFIRSLKLAALVARDSAVTVALNGDKVIITTNEEDRGASKDVVLAQESEGEGTTMGALKYILKAAETALSAFITLQWCELPNGMVALAIMDDAYQHMVCPVMPKTAEAVDED